MKLHDHTRQSGRPSAQRASNGFTREAQKKVFWFFSTEKNDLPYSRSFSGAPSGLRMVGIQECFLLLLFRKKRPSLLPSLAADAHFRCFFAINRLAAYVLRPATHSNPSTRSRELCGFPRRSLRTRHIQARHKRRRPAKPA